jgi:cation transport ATPase
VANGHTHSASPTLDLYRMAGRAGEQRRRHRELAAQIVRYLGAVSILVVGAVHAEQYYKDYFSIVPVIGTLFLLSFIGAGVVGTVLFLPVRRFGRRAGDAILSVAAVGAIGIALGTLVSLLYSEYRPLFGFMESGYRLAIVLTLLFDGLTAVLLGAFLALTVPPLVRSFRSART